MSTTPATRTFAIRGTYPDGIVRHKHVTIAHPQTVIDLADDLLTGILPFAKIEVLDCDDIWTCNHDAQWATEASTITIDPAN